MHNGWRDPEEAVPKSKLKPKTTTRPTKRANQTDQARQLPISNPDRSNVLIADLHPN
jgi:hypothetical protein